MIYTWSRQPYYYIINANLSSNCRDNQNALSTFPSNKRLKIQVTIIMFQIIELQTQTTCNTKNKRTDDLPGDRLRTEDTCPGVSGTRIEGHEYTSWPFRKTKSSMPIYQFENFLKVHFFIVLLFHSKRRIPWHV